MRQETQKDVLAAKQKGSEYDEACKRLFQNKEILAPILKRVVKEYEHCSILRCEGNQPAARNAY